MSTPSHLGIFRLRVTQLGLWRAVRFNLLKLARRMLLDGSQLHFGSHGEDLMILSMARDYLGKERFTYIDVGCHEPRRISNSYLAYASGSSGLAVDLNPAFEAAFRRERPRDVFVCAAVSDEERDMVVHEFAQAEVATIETRQAEEWRNAFTATGTRRLRSVTLHSLVKRHLPGRGVDVLMLDVEGHELPVLRGAHLPQLRPGLIVCEIHARSVAEAAARDVSRYLEEDCGYVLAAFAGASAYFIRRDLMGHPRA